MTCCRPLRIPSPTVKTYVRFEESVRGADAFVIQSHPAPINEWLMEQIIMIDALKRASARSITVVSPFYPYARQDKKHKGREPISARLIADLYKTAGADRLCVSICILRRFRVSLTVRSTISLLSQFWRIIFAGVLRTPRT